VGNREAVAGGSAGVSDKSGTAIKHAVELNERGTGVDRNGDAQRPLQSLLQSRHGGAPLRYGL